jgi:hypothetical protein
MPAKLTVEYICANLAAMAGAVLMIVWRTWPQTEGQSPYFLMSTLAFVLSPFGYAWMIYSLIWHATRELPRTLRWIGILANAIMLLLPAAVMGSALYFIAEITLHGFHLAD